MSFVFKKEGDPIAWPVKVSEPAAHGTTKESKFTAQFVMITRTEFERLSNEGDRALMARVLVGWSGITDEGGNEFPFTAEHRELLGDVPPIQTAIARAYVQFMAGAAAKN